MTFLITVDPVFDVTGTITFQGATSASEITAIDAQVTLTHDGGPVFGTVTVASNGTFSITNAPVDLYSISVIATGYQTATNAAFNVSVADVPMAIIELKGGLVNGDTVVDGVDLSLLVTNFGTTPSDRTDGSGNWVDINGDDAVSGIDISIALSNISLTGIQAWTL